MKMGIIAFILLTSLIIMLTLFNIHLQKTSDVITSSIELTEKYIKDGNYGAAVKNFKNVKEEWKKQQQIYGLLIEHSKLEQINSLLDEAELLINEKKYVEYFLSGRKLCSLIDSIINENQVNAETIL